MSEIKEECKAYRELEETKICFDGKTGYICENATIGKVPNLIKQKSKKECEWCKKESGLFWDHDPDGEGVQVSINSRTSEINIYSNSLCSDILLEVPIKFCPMCGRRLQNE